MCSSRKYPSSPLPGGLGGGGGMGYETKKKEKKMYEA